MQREKVEGEVTVWQEENRGEGRNIAQDFIRSQRHPAIGPKRIANSDSRRGAFSDLLWKIQLQNTAQHQFRHNLVHLVLIFSIL